MKTPTKKTPAKKHPSQPRRRQSIAAELPGAVADLELWAQAFEGDTTRRLKEQAHEIARHEQLIIELRHELRIDPARLKTLEQHYQATAAAVAELREQLLRHMQAESEADRIQAIKAAPAAAAPAEDDTEIFRQACIKVGYVIHRLAKAGIKEGLAIIHDTLLYSLLEFRKEHPTAPAAAAPRDSFR